MRLLVTGAAGQLGVDLCKVAEAAGDEVVAMGHGALDVTNRDSVLQVLGAAAPDVVVNCATWTNVDGCELEPERAFLVNALGVRHLAEGSGLVGARLVQISTDYVFNGRGAGPNGGQPYNEWDATDPLNQYGRSKLGGEREAQSLLGPQATIVRTSWLCGAAGANFVKTMLRLAGERDTLTVVDDQIGCPTFTADLAKLIRQLAVARVPGVFHATNTGVASWCEFARATFAAAGHDPSRVQAITTEELQPARPAPRPAYSVLDNAALRGLGIAPLPEFRESLARLVRELAP